MHSQRSHIDLDKQVSALHPEVTSPASTNERLLLCPRGPAARSRRSSRLCQTMAIDPDPGACRLVHTPQART
jgi:hypothetical protein